MIRQAVVVAGGRGTRLGSLAEKHGNKCLVPIGGKPVLLHTLDWLRESGVKSIIVTVNYVKDFRTISALLEDEPSVAVVGNLSRQTSAQCLPPLRGLLDPRFLFIYGHAPVPPGHLRKMHNMTRQGVVASLYTTSTQRLGAQKPAALKGSRVVLGEDGGLFIEPPHIVDHGLLTQLAETKSWKHSFRNYSGAIHGVRASHPPEYHYPRDLKAVRAWLAEKGPFAKN